MRAGEVPEVFDALSKLDLASMDVVDQMAYILAANRFAERMKPLIAKYADKLPEKTTFHFRM